MEKYEPISYIGKGNFGSIMKIKRKIDGKILVWKELNYGVMSEKDRNRIVQEVNILHELHHPNIVKYYDRILDKKNTKLFIIMEYCPGGDLSKLIKRNKKSNQYFSEDIIWKIFSQVCSALYACHTHKDGKILHRDIKPSNIFIDQENNIKLGDFGLSRVLNTEISFAVSRVGTPYYMSPEQIDDIKYNEKSDIWSLGCFLYELTTLHPPFEAKTPLNLANKIKSGLVDCIPGFYSQKLCEIIKLLMSVDPNKRPNIKEIINIPEINLRIKEKKIKENLKKLKKIENELKIREINTKEKEEELLIKEKYLNEREKNICQREEYIKHKEEEFIKGDENKFNIKDLSMTSGNFNIKCLKITNNNSFMMSNSFSYKNIPYNRENKNKILENSKSLNNINNNNKRIMNNSEKNFHKNNNSSNKKNETDYYSSFNTNHNKNESTNNNSYNINNRNDSTQNASYNINNNVIEVNPNYILYNPNNEDKNPKRYIGTSPNITSIIYNSDNTQRTQKKININVNEKNKYQSNYSVDNEYKNKKCKVFNEEKLNSYDKKEFNKYCTERKFNNKSFKYKKNEKCLNDEKIFNYKDNHKEYIYNNHIINFNNANNNSYGKHNNNYNNDFDDKFNNHMSERAYTNNYYKNINNIKKDLLYKVTSTPKPFNKEKIEYYQEYDYYKAYNNNRIEENNKLFNKENEKQNYENDNYENKNKGNYLKKYNSFNGINTKKNYYRKSNHYNTKKVVNTNIKKGANNLNTINF